MKNKLKLKLFLAGTMLASLLTGCGGGGTKSTDQPKETPKAQEKTQEKPQEKAQDSSYPSKSITIYLPYSAGGTSDVMTRALEPFLKDKLGQTVVVENKAGGSGAIAMNTIITGKPDGYSLAISSNGPSVITPMLNNVGYTFKDYTPISQIASIPYVFTVPKNSPYKSVKEFFDAAKANPNKLKIATPGATTSQALIVSQLSKEQGVQFNVVPFDGGAETLNALLGGNADASLNLETEVVTQIRSGKVKGLAISQKSEFLPDIPTFKEQGINKDFIGAFYGLVANKETPQPIIDKLDQVMKDVLADPKIKEQLAKIYLSPVYTDSKGFRALIDKYNEETKVTLNK